MNRYTIKHKIGSGGMATVHLARDTVLGRDVAIKMLHAHLLERPESVKRFRNEAHVAATLSHDNIVKVFDYGEEDGHQYIVMEYINGTTLDEMVRTYGPLPNTVLLSLISQMSCGLAVAHAAGVLHRDIKPANILIDALGQARVADFGIAHLVNSESMTLTGSFMGSPEFLSPEQADGKSLTDRTDIFSLGSTLYFCATGAAPFAQENPHAALRSILEHEPASAMARNPRCLQVLSDLITRCLTKDPALRPSASQCVEAIQAICGAHHLPNDRQGIQKFRSDAQAFAQEEKAWLFAHYRSQALSCFERKKMADGVRFLSQARAFGDLLPSDEKYLRPPLMTTRRAVLALLLLVAASGIAYLLLSRSPGPQITELTDSTTVGSTVTTLDSARATPKQLQDTAVRATGGGTGHRDSSSRGASAESTPTVARHPGAVDSRTTTAPESTPDADSVQSVPAGPATGWVLVKSNPPWANIYIDGAQKGFTPKNAIIEVPAGSHELAIRKSGYADLNQTVVVESADTTAVMVELTVLK